MAVGYLLERDFYGIRKIILKFAIKHKVPDLVDIVLEKAGDSVEDAYELLKCLVDNDCGVVP